MACDRSVFCAVADPVRLQHVIERQPAGDALGADPQRTRRDHLDFAMPEPFAAAAIVDGGRAARSLEHLGGAIGPAMFEPGECRNVRNALVKRRFGSRSAADFPQAGCAWPSDGGSAATAVTAAARPAAAAARIRIARRVIARAFTTSPVTTVSGKSALAQESSLGWIAKLDEQKAQSTVISPSSPIIASRSSAGNRAITERT